jgi:multidrug resistance efflux pump
LQAAIADPDVTARIGRLTKAERWSGFGELGDSTAVFATPQASDEIEPSNRGARRSTAEPSSRHHATAERVQREQARALLTAALADRQNDLAAARRQLDDARRQLAEAEAAVASAGEKCRDAEQASLDAADALKAAMGDVRKR